MAVLFAICPLRIRVSMSPSGSLIAILAIPALPARLDHARDLALRGQLPERDARQAELAVVSARTARQDAAVADAHLGTIARQLRQLQGRVETLLGIAALVHDDRL